MTSIACRFARRESFHVWQWVTVKSVHCKVSNMRVCLVRLHVQFLQIIAIGSCLVCFLWSPFPSVTWHPQIFVYKYWEPVLPDVLYFSIVCFSVKQTLTFYEELKPRLLREEKVTPLLTVTTFKPPPSFPIRTFCLHRSDNTTGSALLWQPNIFRVVSKFLNALHVHCIP